jgi:methyl-accepting chemotaxis protein
MQYPWVSHAHQTFRYVLVIQWLVSIGIGAFLGNWFEPLLIGTLILIVPFFMSLKFPTEAISRHAVGVGVQLFTALHIQQTYGLTEIHFEIFTLLAFLSFYRDWKVIASSTLIVAIHHILFFILQTNSSGVFIFEEGHVEFHILVIHAVFAVIEGSVLMYMSKKNNSEGRSALLLSQSVSTIMQDKHQLDFTATDLRDDGDLKEFNQLISAIKILVSESRQLSENAVDITDKVQASAIQLSSSYETSLKQVTNINLSIKDIVSAVNTITLLSEQATTLSTEAETKTSNTAKNVIASGKGIETLRDTLTLASSAIQELSEKCQNISTVMQSIKTVAEQTNLLALNAAIESARAGEHGRGFAVVADEVRQLAIKSKMSAEEIETITATLISSASNSVIQMNDCVSRVDTSVAESSKNVKVMQEIVSSISEVSANVRQIASASKQQYGLSTTISDAALQLDILSKDESLYMQSVKHEVSSLHDMCVALLKQIGQFKV